jgi:hypothetical protein
MSDERTEELLRHARATGGGEAWRDAGAALAQAGRYDEAGDALLRAATTGTPVAEVHESFEPALDDFAARSIEIKPSAMSLAFFGAVAWSQDGGTVFLVDNGVYAHDVASGETRTVFETMPWRVQAVAPNPAGTHLVARLCFDASIQAYEGLAAIEVATGSISGWVAREADRLEPRLQPPTLAWPSEDPFVLVGDDGSVEKRELAISEPVPATVAKHASGERIWHLEGNLHAVDRSGLTVGIHGDHLEFHLDSEVLGRCDYVAEDQALRRLHAARDRVVILSGESQAALYDRAGERASAKLPYADTWLPSPSGRRLAGIHTGETGEAASRVQLVDLAEGTCRQIDLPLPPPTAMAWSPSGRRLALAHEGRVTFLEPNGE